MSVATTLGDHQAPTEYKEVNNRGAPVQSDQVVIESVRSVLNETPVTASVWCHDRSSNEEMRSVVASVPRLPEQEIPTVEQSQAVISG